MNTARSPTYFWDAPMVYPMRLLIIATLLLASSLAFGQQSDSTMYHKLNGQADVLAVYYHQDFWKSGQLKTEGWVYLKKLDGKKRYYRYGSWKEYYKNGIQIVQANYPENKGWVEHNRWDLAGNKEWECRIQVKTADEFAVANLGREFEGKNYFVKYFLANQLESTGYFKQGQKDGTWKYYAKSGMVVRQEIYFNGGLLSTRKTEPSATLTQQ